VDIGYAAVLLPLGKHEHGQDYSAPSKTLLLVRGPARIPSPINSRLVKIDHQ
jgi:hypothetical protein